MKRKIILLVAALSLFAAGSVFGGAVNGYYGKSPIVKIMSGGKEIQDEIPAHIIDGKTVVPLTTLRSLGAEVTWDGERYVANVEMPKPLSEEQKAEIKRNVGIVYTLNKNGKWSQGTCFVVEGGKTLTSYHIVEEDGTIGKVRVDIDGKTYEDVPVIWYDSKYDVAQLKLDANVPGLKTQNSAWLVGQRVIAAGFQHAKWVITEGETKVDYSGLQYHTADLEPGSSGSPLLNSSGHVVAINQGAREFTEINFADDYSKFKNNFK